MAKTEYYTAIFYNKYNFSQYIKIDKLELENISQITELFAQKYKGVLNQDNQKGNFSQINLREISYIEYKKESNE